MLILKGLPMHKECIPHKQCTKNCIGASGIHYHTLTGIMLGGAYILKFIFKECCMLKVKRLAPQLSHIEEEEEEEEEGEQKERGG
jgi:hypothetical protein